MSRFTAVTEDPHNRFNQKIAVLLTNLGTPDKPETSPVRTYLQEFLSDPRIVEIPRFIWMCILHGIILRVRPKRSAAAYASIWSEDGSPLLVISKQQKAALKQRLEQNGFSNVEVELAMRYGNPSIASTLQEIREKGITRIVVLPLYPQYSSPTTGSTFDAIAQEISQWRWVPELHFINGYHKHPLFISAIANQINEFLTQHKPQKIVFSYHGMPQQFLEQGDPYHCFCQQTTRLVMEQVNYPKDDAITCFQSRFGKAEWLKPYTDKTLEAFPEQGITDIAILSPAFSADCLETLEELQEENKELFEEAGGKSYHYIPCLNATPEHIDLIEDLVKPYI